MPKQDKFRTEDWAAFWRVTQRSIQKWIAAHKEGKMPMVSDVPAMLAWELNAKLQSQAFRARCAEIRAGGAAVSGPANTVAPKAPAADWEKFKSATEGKRFDPKKIIAQMEEFAGFFHYMLEQANVAGDQAKQRFYSDLFFDAANSIRQQKLAADKLGIEEGNLFSKDQLAKIIRAWAFWSFRGIDAELADLCPKLPGLKSVAQARAILEPVLLSVRFVKPFARAARVESESSLAPWIVETIADAVDDFIEEGAAAFKEEIAK
jgi:hypothetical protein